MAFKVRKIPESVLYAVVAVLNAKQTDEISANFHADTTQTQGGTLREPTVTDDVPTSANASTTPTAVALANEIKAVVNRHFADTIAHDSAVSAKIATADATDEATAMTLANAIKTAYGTHLSEANVHFNNDGTNTIAAAAATTTGTLDTLLNELKTDVAAHVRGAPSGAMIVLQAP